MTDKDVYIIITAGPVSPVASNSTEEGRAQNRHVEIAEQ